MFSCKEYHARASDALHVLRQQHGQRLGRPVGYWQSTQMANLTRVVCVSSLTTFLKWATWCIMVSQNPPNKRFYKWNLKAKTSSKSSKLNQYPAHHLFSWFSLVQSTSITTRRSATTYLTISTRTRMATCRAKWHNSR